VDLTQFVNAFSSTPIPTVLLLVGLILVLVGVFKVDLALGGNSIKIDSSRQFLAFMLGAVLFVTGLSMHQKVNPINLLKDFHYANIRKGYDKGTILMFQGNYPEAVKIFINIIKDNPNYAPAWNQLAVALSQTVSDPDFKPVIQGSSIEKLDQGMSVLDINNEALFLDPRYSAAWYNRGHILLGSKKTEDNWDIRYSVSSRFLSNEALKCFERAIAVNSKWEEINLSDVWADRGFLLTLSSDIAGAKNSYEKALEINPGNIKAKEGIELLNTRPLDLRDYRHRE
jgi:tetratricopeptide (TPR) repeat protein